MAVGRPPSPEADQAPPDTDSVPSRRRRRTAVALFWGAVAAMVLVVTLPGSPDEKSEARRAPAVASSAPPEGRSAGPPAHTHRTEGKHLPRSRPVRLLIPKISVDAPFTDLAIGSTGQLQPPPAGNTNLVGWYANGASPGEAGTSIIAGHVDTTTSPAVFASLSELKKGDSFQVLRADGRKASFRIDNVETFDKDNFPSKRVYGDTPRARVRLITCAGDYDRKVRDYTANLVVFAHLA